MDAIHTAGLTLALVPLLAQAGPFSGTGATSAATDAVGPPGVRPDDPLATVGLALLAYGVVQILSRVIERLPFGRGSPAAESAADFTAEDRKRMERMLEIVLADHDRVERMQETLREVHEQTRNLAEMRLRVDARDGEPLWRCRAAAVAEQASTNQRLIGQTLDEVRATQGRLDEMGRKLDDVLRKLRALWIKVGRRKGDRR